MIVNKRKIILIYSFVVSCYFWAPLQSMDPKQLDISLYQKQFLTHLLVCGSGGTAVCLPCGPGAAQRDAEAQDELQGWLHVHGSGQLRELRQPKPTGAHTRPPEGYRLHLPAGAHGNVGTWRKGDKTSEIFMRELQREILDMGNFTRQCWSECKKDSTSQRKFSWHNIWGSSWGRYRKRIYSLIKCYELL